MPWQSVRQVTEIARLWMVRHSAFVSAGTVRQESDAACPSDPRDGFIDFPLLDGLFMRQDSPEVVFRLPYRGGLTSGTKRTGMVRC
jgi:hypothetical protein